MLDSDGNIVTASNDTRKSEEYVNVPMKTDIMQRAKTGSTSKDSYIGFRGERVYGQYKWSAGKSWVVVGEITQREVFQKLNQLSIAIIIISLVALILSIGAAVTIASRIERPIRYLLRGTKIIQNGNYD
ncbi:hypothetical protein AB4Z22_45370, partial [Paenibacillus sp. TAF58]